jgi:hypothetical protein
MGGNLFPPFLSKTVTQELPTIQATLTGIEDDYISIHDTYRFFFLSNPIVGMS